MEENEILRKAKKRVRAKKGFYIHLTTYVIVMSFLFFINLMTSPNFWWFLFPLAGWAMGIAGHYFTVFGLLGVGNRDWERKEVAKELERLQQEEDPSLISEGLALPDDHLELKEKIKLPKDWDEQDFV